MPEFNIVTTLTKRFRHAPDVSRLRRNKGVRERQQLIIALPLRC